jgi:hypothetical protein
MSLRICWQLAAERHLKDIGWHPAESVDAAVIRYAATGRGDIERLNANHYRLRVGVYRVWLRIDDQPVGAVMHVLGVYGPRHPRR